MLFIIYIINFALNVAGNWLLATCNWQIFDVRKTPYLEQE